MNQLVRQMKVWDLRADAREPITSEGLEFDATGGHGGLCDAPELIDDLETSGSSSGSVSPDVEMHDTSDPVVVPPTLSHISPQSDTHHDGPMVVDDDVSPSVDASYALATLSDTASISSSLLSIIKRQKSDAMELDRASTNDVTGPPSIKDSLTISSRSSWSFGRVTGLQHSPRSSVSGSQHGPGSTRGTKPFNFSRPFNAFPVRQKSLSSGNLNPILEDRVSKYRSREPLFYREGRVFEQRWYHSTPTPLYYTYQTFVVSRRFHGSFRAVRIYDRQSAEFEKLLELRGLYKRFQLGFMYYDGHLDMDLPASMANIKHIKVDVEGQDGSSLPSLGIADFSDYTVLTLEDAGLVDDRGIVTLDSMRLLKAAAECGLI